MLILLGFKFFNFKKFPQIKMFYFQLFSPFFLYGVLSTQHEQCQFSGLVYANLRTGRLKVIHKNFNQIPFTHFSNQ